MAEHSELGHLSEVLAKGCPATASTCSLEHISPDSEPPCFSGSCHLAGRRSSGSPHVGAPVFKSSAFQWASLSHATMSNKKPGCTFHHAWQSSQLNTQVDGSHPPTTVGAELGGAFHHVTLQVDGPLSSMPTDTVLTSLCPPQQCLTHSCFYRWMLVVVSGTPQGNLPVLLCAAPPYM